jgi:cytochrome c556
MFPVMGGNNFIGPITRRLKVSKSLIAAAVVVAFGGGIAVEVMAQPNPNQLISNRKGAMNLQGKYFGPMLAMAQGKAAYDPKIVQRNADYLAVISQLPWDDFQPHSLGLPNTRAKEDIAKDTAKFRATVEQLQGNIQKLQAAARSGDEAAVKVAVPAVGRTCNGCHENFTTMNFRFPI